MQMPIVTTYRAIIGTNAPTFRQIGRARSMNSMISMQVTVVKLMRMEAAQVQSVSQGTYAQKTSRLSSIHNLKGYYQLLLCGT